MSSTSTDPKCFFISYLKARKLVSKECIYYLVRVNDSNAEVPSFKSVSIVKEFPEIFLYNIPVVLPLREIDFNININPYTRPMYFPSFIMAPVELKEQLKVLLDKGFM